MKKIQRWLEAVERRRISRNFDAFALFIGGEGVGKSTLMISATWLWQQIRGKQPTPETVLDRMAHDDRRAFQELLLNSDKGQAIIANDAAHILHKKEAMHGEQVEVEKNLLDIRTFNYLVMMGYQDWDDVADQLQRRRAHFAFRIPRRGAVYGYNRTSLDEKYDTGEWPDPDFKDSFPDLQGTDVWQEFNELDVERKRNRLKTDESPDADDVYWREQCKTALRAVRPWDEERGMTQSDAEKLIDYSDSWISDRVNEWRDGQHRDLFGDDELPTA